MKEKKIKMMMMIEQCFLKLPALMTFFSLRKPREQRETDTDIKPVANINKD